MTIKNERKNNMLSRKKAIKVYETVFNEKVEPHFIKGEVDDLVKEMNAINEADSVEHAAKLLDDFDYGTDCSHLLDAYRLRKEMGWKEPFPTCPTCKRSF